MVLPIDPSDVRRHLQDLGYNDLDDAELHEFVRDLKRLVKYEERRERRKEQLGVVEKEADRSAATTSTSSSGDKEESPSRRLRSRHRRPERKSEKPEVSARARRRKALAEIITNDEEEGEEDGADETETTASTSRASTETEFAVRVRRATASSPPALPSVPRPASKFSSAPTTSFIRPPKRGRRPKGLKTDPVRLHEYYQKIWSKTNFPGGESTKAARWAVREWMMGEQS